MPRLTLDVQMIVARLMEALHELNRDHESLGFLTFLNRYQCLHPDARFINLWTGIYVLLILYIATVGLFMITFGDENNAIRLKERMLAWGRKAVIRKFDRGDMIFYRVQVRAGDTLSAAEQVEKVMTNEGFPGAFVVAR